MLTESDAEALLGRYAATALAATICNGDVTARKVLEAAIAGIERIDGTLNALNLRFYD